MQRLLHISSNEYPKLSEEHTTKKIWRELAIGFDEYHIIARAKDNKFHNYQEGNIFLHLVPKLGKSKSFFFTSVFMLKIIHKHKINLLLSQCPLLGGYFATFISKIYKIPLMIEIHGLEYFKILQGKRLHQKLISKLIRFSLSNATKVRSLSSKMTKMLIENNVKANIVEIPNRVNISLFNVPKKSSLIEKKIKVISVGRFVWEKAYDNAIKSIIDLNKFYDIDLTLVGGGPLQSVYEKLAEGSKSIRLIEWLPQEEFVPLLNESDIYIQPSISEGMPRTILEAMAMRLPVIASDVGAISGVINNNINGILIQPEEKESLKNAIEMIINNNELRETIARNGYQDAISKYEWTNVFKKYRCEINKMKYRDNDY